MCIHTQRHLQRISGDWNTGSSKSQVLQPGQWPGFQGRMAPAMAAVTAPGIQGGVRRHGGSPIAGWFLLGKIPILNG